MAKHESDREDLLREATAMPRRVEVRIENDEEPIFVGFRRDGSVSFYFSSDFVVQFNTSNEIRRGYLDGLLLKADRGLLVGLRRERTPDKVELVRLPIDQTATDRWLDSVERHLHQLAVSLESGQFELRGEVPDGGEVLQDVRSWLKERPPARLARNPHAR